MQTNEVWPIAQHAIPHFGPADKAKLYAAIMRGDVQVTVAYDDKGLLGIILTVLYVDPILSGTNLMIYGIKAVRRLTISQCRKAIAELINQAMALGCNTVSAYTSLRSVRSLMHRFGAIELTYVSVKI